MRKRIVIIVITCLMMLLGCVGIGIKSYAYTEEQKQQAKAWLSAHGYSPDAGGAAAAYQDYLNGKFDEELGITREETTGSSQSAYEDPDEEKEEKTTEESTETPVRINSVWDFMGVDQTEQSADDDSDLTSEETTEVNTSEEHTTQFAYEEPEEDIYETRDLEEKEVYENNVESTLYSNENIDKYREAIIVVVLAVLGIAIGFGAVTLMKR